MTSNTFYDYDKTAKVTFGVKNQSFGGKDIEIITVYINGKSQGFIDNLKLHHKHAASARIRYHRYGVDNVYIWSDHPSLSRGYRGTIKEMTALKSGSDLKRSGLPW